MEPDAIRQSAEPNSSETSEVETDSESVVVQDVESDCMSDNNDVDTNEQAPEILTPGEIKQRITRGNRRRADVTQNTARRLRGHASRILLTFSTLLGTVASAMAEPLNQMGTGVYECSRAFVSEKTERPWIYEVCGGWGAVTEEFASQGYAMARPKHVLYGDDLYDPKIRAQIKLDVQISRPRLIVMGWPCRLWGGLANINFATPEEKQRLRRLRRKEKPILELFKDLTYLQLARGDHISGESPLWSKALDEKPILRVLNREDCHVIRTDACSHGLKDPTTGSYMLKPPLSSRRTPRSTSWVRGVPVYTSTYPSWGPPSVGWLPGIHASLLAVCIAVCMVACSPNTLYF